MVVIEGHFISHFMEPVEVPDQDLVDSFVPPVAIPNRFDVDNPGFAVPVVSQKEYFHYRRLMQEAMDYSLDVIAQVDAEFRETFGRGYSLVEAVHMEDAELALVTTATITSTARVALKRLRDKGYKVGLVKIRVFRPFPVKALREILDDIPRIAVIDRNISLGREGIFCSELKAALIHSPAPHLMQGYVAGIGGTNVDPELIERIVMDAMARNEATDGPIMMTEES
jgi:pyruvate/2-oxoacid:ferredoxin oxidoreductase alpha subunit